MNIDWNNIDQLEDYFITYLLYKESKTVPQISKIRNISTMEVKDQLIRAKLEIKSMSKNKLESSKDILDKYLELDKSERLDFIDELGLDDDRMLKFKRELYKRIRLEKNAEDLIILIPHCIQNHNCKLKVTNDIDNCKKCGMCKINELLQLKEKYNTKIFIATGGTLARKVIIDNKPKAVIAVACERDLTSGVRDVKGIPVLGVFNLRPNGPCVDTNINIKEVEEAISFFTHK